MMGELGGCLLWSAVAAAFAVTVTLLVNLARHGYRWREAWRDMTDGDPRDIEQLMRENAEIADRMRRARKDVE